MRTKKFFSLLSTSRIYIAQLGRKVVEIIRRFGRKSFKLRRSLDVSRFELGPFVENVLPCMSQVAERTQLYAGQQASSGCSRLPAATTARALYLNKWRCLLTLSGRRRWIRVIRRITLIRGNLPGLAAFSSSVLLTPVPAQNQSTRNC